MSGFQEIKKGLANIQLLERELNLKQLQINRLLNITQAINNNVSAEGLFQMYNSFLSWEVSVKKMALFIKDDKTDEWGCASSIGISEKLLKIDISSELAHFKKLLYVENSTNKLIKEFDVVIPVLHKDEAIAYVFIGGFDENEDMYSKVQFITTITNIIAVAIENKRLFRRQIEQERLRREMELAGDMQRMLIPPELPKQDYYELASIYKPHLGVGGDYFDYIEFKDGKLTFCIGDISGKGIAAALLMANFQANFHTLANQRNPLDEFIINLNRAVFHITGGERFITFFVAEYDRESRMLTYVNAGHNPPVLVIEGEEQLLKYGCTILGSFKKLPPIEVGQILIDGEALLLSFTDGLTDIRNKENEFLDEHQIYKLVRENYRLSASNFNTLLMKEIELFKGEKTYPDDFTVLTSKFFN